MKTKQTESLATQIVVEDQSTPKTEVKVSRLRKAAAITMGVGALTLVGCSAPSGGESAPAPTSVGAEGAGPAPTVPSTIEAPTGQVSAAELRSQASETVVAMKDSINETFQMYSSLVVDEAAGDDGSNIQHVDLTVGDQSYTLQLQRFDPEMPSEGVNLETVSVTAFSANGNMATDFAASFYPDGSLYKYQATDLIRDNEYATRSVEFTDTGAITETGAQATAADQSNILVHAQAVLAAAQGN